MDCDLLTRGKHNVAPYRVVARLSRVPAGGEG
jgi:hypothetical protein